MNNWNAIIKKLDFALQPIVHINSGIVYGCEVLLRNYSDAGFSSIQEVFDTAYSQKSLYYLDLNLREKAIKKFKKLPFSEDTKIFYNLDPRILQMPGYSPGNTEAILEKHGLDRGDFCFEVSEKYDIDDWETFEKILNIYSSRGYITALDDFGSGFSNLKLLLKLEPKIVKIDRFFINFINQDSKKRASLKKMIELIHSMNGLVVAEGVETEKEYCTCRSIGCDLVQGYFIQRPTLFVDELLPKYNVPDSINENWYSQIQDKNIILKNLDNVHPINKYANIRELLKSFKNEKKRRIFPIINAKNEPLGVIKEDNIKKYVYSPYGMEILAQKIEKENNGLNSFISHCPTCDINYPLENILYIFSNTNADSGVIITENSKYLGYLNSSSLINVIHEKKISEAKELNPLTKLPGNHSIEKYIVKTINLENDPFAYVYLDFNKFKAFNDRFGFQKGDEVISYFADFLKQKLTNENAFIGHIGGDDFFVGLSLEGKDSFLHLTNFFDELRELFTKKIRFFYPKVKNLEKIEDLTVSISMLLLPPGRRSSVYEEVSELIFKIKKISKSSPNSFSCTSLR